MAETVTVRMSRGDVGTPWGFDIASGDRGEPVITNVRGGSLADRAGLRNDDVLDILESLDNLDALAADRLVATSRNQIELIVHRQPGGASASARAWKPPEFSSSDVSSTINKFQSTTLNDHRASSYTNGNSSNSYSRGPSVGAGGGAGSGFGGGGGIGGGPHDRSIKVNLEHHPEVIVPQGFNKPALPFATDPRVQHLQYNSPLNIYSAQTAAEQYLQQTGGLFGTDPKLANRQAPSYLQSETLRLVQEEDKFGNREVRLRPEPRAAPTLSSHPNPANLPVCFLCGRHILGVLCRAAGHDLHADCFVCATCGAPLRNQGHHVVNDKFYCDVHGRQRQHFGGAPSIPPEIVVKSSPTAAHPVRPQETLKAPYQPDVLHRGPLSISPTRWKTQSPISPANRGVPASATQYGQDFKRDIIHESSSTYAAPPPPPPPSNPPPGTTLHQPAVVKVAATIPAPIQAVHAPAITVEQPTPMTPNAPKLPPAVIQEQDEPRTRPNGQQQPEAPQEALSKPVDEPLSITAPSPELKVQKVPESEPPPSHFVRASTVPLSQRIPGAVKEVTSPRFRGSVRARQWPPPGVQSNRFWKIDANADKKDETGVSSLEAIVREEDRQRRRSESPRRSPVLRGQARPVPKSDAQRLVSPTPPVQLSPPARREPPKTAQVAEPSTKPEERIIPTSVSPPLIKPEEQPKGESPLKIEERVIMTTVSPDWRPRDPSPVGASPEPRALTPTITLSDTSLTRPAEKAEAAVTMPTSVPTPSTQSPTLPKGIVATKRPSLFKAEDFAHERRPSMEELKPLQIPVTTPPVYAMSSPKPFRRDEPTKKPRLEGVKPPVRPIEIKPPDPTPSLSSQPPPFLSSPSTVSKNEVYYSLPKPFKSAKQATTGGGAMAKKRVDFSKQEEAQPVQQPAQEIPKNGDHNSNTLLQLSRKAQELMPQLDDRPLREKEERERLERELKKAKAKTQPPVEEPSPIPIKAKQESAHANITMDETRELVREHKRVILGTQPSVTLPQTHPLYPKGLEEHLKDTLERLPVREPTPDIPLLALAQLNQVHPVYPKELEEKVQQVIQHSPQLSDVPSASTLTLAELHQTHPIYGNEPEILARRPRERPERPASELSQISQSLPTLTQAPPQHLLQPKPQRWKETAEVIDESDILTEVSRISDDDVNTQAEADNEDDESSLHLPSFDERTSDFLKATDNLLYDDDEDEDELVFAENKSGSSTEREEESEDEPTEETKERWIREEVEQAKQEESGVAVVSIVRRARKSVEAPETEEDIEQLNRDLEIVAALNRRLDDLSELGDEDRQRAIESIERHQQSLEDQQEELSGLLDSAIAFLHNLDAELGARRLKMQLEEQAMGLEGPVNTNQLNDVLEELRGISMVAPVMVIDMQDDDDEQEALKVLAPEFTVFPYKPVESPLIPPLSPALSSPRVETTSDFIVNALRTTQEAEKSPSPRSPRSPRSDGESYSRQTFREERRTTSTTEDSARGRLVSAIPAGSGGRIPVCEACKQQIRGAYVLAAGLAWCPEHFICANASCGRRLLDVGFVEEKGKKYCEACFANHIAPRCAKCSRAITADCLNALQKQWHPECFTCAHCAKPFGNSAFYLENGQPYCEQDWNQLFTTKCISCSYPIEAGDRWVEALGSAYHSNCFNCTRCQVNLEGESFYAKNGQPYCKQHA